MKKEEIKKKEWVKPEVKNLSIKKETLSGTKSGNEVAGKQPVS
jgi:hypothetical protein